MDEKRNVIVELEVDETGLEEGTLDFVEKQLSSLDRINLHNARILDTDDAEDKAAIKYADKIFNGKVTEFVKLIDRDAEDCVYYEVTLPADELSDFGKVIAMAEKYASTTFFDVISVPNPGCYDEYLDEMLKVSGDCDACRFEKYFELRGYEIHRIEPCFFAEY